MFTCVCKNVEMIDNLIVLCNNEHIKIKFYASFYCCFGFAFLSFNTCEISKVAPNLRNIKALEKSDN